MERGERERKRYKELLPLLLYYYSLIYPNTLRTWQLLKIVGSTTSAVRVHTHKHRVGLFLHSSERTNKFESTNFDQIFMTIENSFLLFLFFFFISSFIWKFHVWISRACDYNGGRRKKRKQIRGEVGGISVLFYHTQKILEEKSFWFSFCRAHMFATESNLFIHVKAISQLRTQITRTHNRKENNGELVIFSLLVVTLNLIWNHFLRMISQLF